MQISPSPPSPRADAGKAGFDLGFGLLHRPRLASPRPPARLCVCGGRGAVCAGRVSINCLQRLVNDNASRSLLDRCLCLRSLDDARGREEESKRRGFRFVKEARRDLKRRSDASPVFFYDLTSDWMIISPDVFVQVGIKLRFLDKRSSLLHYHYNNFQD